HLSLTEGAVRLPGSTELELLRISHEAINAARRRPDVKHIWVTLRVDPPAASMVIEDDGTPDAAGIYRTADLRMMVERAERIHAAVFVERRQPRGSTVRVEVGGRDAEGAVG
ncbi:MAG: hypothetical protein ABIM89_10100, partial [Mycobacteriales bacterium]